jgi:Predicted ICC-like phosphoesterases
VIERRYAERAVYLPAVDLLVCADLHLGRGDGPGYHLPLGDPAPIMQALDRLLARFSPAEVVIAGDIVDRFGPPDPPTRAMLKTLRSHCTTAGARLQLVAGNHDRGLVAMADPPLPTELTRGRDQQVVICHGDSLPSEEGALVIYGHDHPTLTVEGARYPCILEGRSPSGTTLCQLPSFSPAVIGVGVGPDRAGLRSPLSQAATWLRPVITDPDSGRTHRFPELSSLAGHL